MIQRLICVTILAKLFFQRCPLDYQQCQNFDKRVRFLFSFFFLTFSRFFFHMWGNVIHNLYHFSLPFSGPAASKAIFPSEKVALFGPQPSSNSPLGDSNISSPISSPLSPSQYSGQSPKGAVLLTTDEGDGAPAISSSILKEFADEMTSLPSASPPHLRRKYSPPSSESREPALGRRIIRCLP